MRIRLLCRERERDKDQLDLMIRNLFPQAIYGVHNIVGSYDVITIYPRGSITRKDLERRNMLLAVEFELLEPPMIIGKPDDNYTY